MELCDAGGVQRWLWKGRRWSGRHVTLCYVCCLELLSPEPTCRRGGKAGLKQLTVGVNEIGDRMDNFRQRWRIEWEPDRETAIATHLPTSALFWVSRRGWTTVKSNPSEIGPATLRTIMGELAQIVTGPASLH